MKKNFFIFFLLTLTSCISFAQPFSFQKQQEMMDLKKLQGKATGKEQLINPDAPNNISRVSSPTFPGNQTTSACNCWLPRDASWLVAPMNGSGASGGPGTAPLYRNDDWSTPVINLPFNLCFYGQTINQVYINNNGNVSIGGPYSTFTAASFPDPSYTMIAPFWGDVDTRGTTSGVVYYKLTPTYLVVQWENVGYFNMADDKKNSFQLIITDGNDPILGPGNNVSFCYQDMQWTTGSASGGVNGFGGTPATVGVNQGNGFDYIQFGLFDQAGGAYDGPFGTNDGVDWLDNQNFTFSFCTSGANIPPVLNTLNVCDTIFLCQGQTVNYTANYYAPEMGQLTNIVLNPGSMSGISVVSNTPGNTASLDFSITGVTPGIFSFQLVATDDGTPAGVTTNTIVVRVYPAPTANASFLPASPVQLNTAVQFTNLSSPGSLLTWNFGDGTPTSSLPNPSHTYTAGGTYTVTLTAMLPNGCSSTWTSQIIVQSCSVTSTFTSTNVCEGTPSTITFTGSALATSVFNWDFVGGTVLSGSGSGPYQIQWSNPGTYSVSLNVADAACTSTPTTVSTIVYPNPVALISSIPDLCTGGVANVSFTGTAGSGATYNWNFGSAAVNSGSGAGPYNLQWNAPGNYSVLLTVSENGCSNSTTVNANVYAIPTADFSLTPSACANAPVTVAYSGTASPVANYVWNFDVATVGSGSGVGPYSVSFSNGGTYNVSLTVSENGCTSTPVNQTVNITDNPVVAISSTPSLCVNDNNSISFTGTALASALFTWNFNGGIVASGSGSGPYDVSWTAPGNYSVSLSVDQNGCSAQTSVPVIVNYIPSSDFTVTPAVCFGDPVTVNFTGIGTATANYQWNFNGGSVNSGSGAGPYSIQYTSLGSNQISLVVSENGCTSTVNLQSTNINPIPDVDAGTGASVCSGVAVNVGALTPLPGATYSWTPSTGVADPSSAQTTITPVNTNTVNQQTTYTLNVTDANGCINSDQVTIEAFPLPVVNFIAPPDQCVVNNNFTFSAISNLPVGVNYTWSFSGGSPSGSSNTTENVTYPAPGTYSVALNAEYNGCVAPVFSDVVNVREMPVTDFIPQVFSGCQPLTVPFSNFSSGTGNRYNWSFYDGTSGDTATNPVHIFNNAGIYSVTLSSTNVYGCRTDSTLNNVIEVFPEAVARFTPNPPVANVLSPSIQFQNYSSNVLTYNWSFGDGETSSERNPSHTYVDTGSYQVMLIVTSPDGCIDSISGIVRVEDNFSFYIPNAFTPNGDGVNDTFKGFGVAIRSYSISIYNRWGELIFRSNDLNQAWDGKIKDVVQNDIYVYRIEIVDHHDEKHIFTGNVSVIQ